MMLLYIFGRLFVRPLSAEEQERIEMEHAKAKQELKPIPLDITIALALLIALLSAEALMLPSTLIYWLLKLPFTDSILKLDRVGFRVGVYVIAYIGASLCWRWCLPLLRYEFYSLVSTLFELPIRTHRRTTHP
jgi:hypothetical protein